MTKPNWLLIGGIAAIASGCGGSSKPSVTPTLNITSPATGSTVTMNAQLTSPVVFATENFTLKAAGTPGCGVGCGHVQLLIDGALCTPAGASWNNIGATSPIDARFGACGNPVGSHQISLELHNNDNSPLLNASGSVISSSVNVTTIAASSGVPTITLTSPADGATVTLGTDVNKSVPVTFTTQNFTLAAVGTPGCGTGCGHVDILIDGSACDAASQSFNAQASASPANALFGLCGTATGSHKLTLQLHNTDDSLVQNAAAATATITTQ